MNNGINKMPVVLSFSLFSFCRRAVPLLLLLFFLFILASSFTSRSLVMLQLMRVHFCHHLKVGEMETTKVKLIISLLKIEINVSVVSRMRVSYGIHWHVAQHMRKLKHFMDAICRLSLNDTENIYTHLTLPFILS